MVLGYDKARINILVNNTQLARSLLRQGVVARDVLAVGILHLESALSIGTGVGTNVGALSRCIRNGGLVSLVSQNTCKLYLLIAGVLGAVIRNVGGVCDAGGNLKRGNGQLTGREHGAISIVVAGNIFSICVRDGVPSGKRTHIRTARNVRTLGGRVGNRQDIILAKALDRVVLVINVRTRTGHGRGKLASALLGTVVRQFSILDGDFQLTGSDVKGTELFLDAVILGVNVAPFNLVAVRRATDLGLSASGSNGNFTLVCLN